LASFRTPHTGQSVSVAFIRWPLFTKFIAINCLNRVEIRQLVRRLGRNPTSDQKLDLGRKRQRLAGRIREFHRTAERYLGAQTVSNLGNLAEIIEDQDGNISDDDNPDAPRPSPSDIENKRLIFPSQVTNLTGQGIALLQKRELELRRGRANDALQGVREVLGHLSFQYIEKVRRSTTTAQHLRSWKGIRTLNSELSYHRRIYNISQRVIVGLNRALKACYPPLLVKQCVISTAIADLNAPGQSQASLAWFWGAMDGYDEASAQNIGADNRRLLECE